MSFLLLCIDPGVSEIACALFADSALIRARFVQPGLHWLDVGAFRADEVVAEIPQFDSRVPIHVITLTMNACYLAGTAHRAESANKPTFVTPTEWKGSLPKPIHHAKVWAALSLDEKACFPKGTAERIERARQRGAKDAWRKDGAYYYGKGKGHEVHNLLDAAGLGLWHTGRLKKGK